MSGIRLGARRTRNVIAQINPPLVSVPGSGNETSALDRALGEMAEAVNATSAQDFYEADVDLIVGANVIVHGLGRTPAHVTVTPSSASASFAWGWDPRQTANRSPDRLTTVDVAGIPMRARVTVS